MKLKFYNVNINMTGGIFGKNSKSVMCSENTI